MQEGSQLPGQEDVTITAQEKLGRPGAARGMSAVREINVPTASSTARDLSHLHHSVHEVSSIEECTVVKRDGMLVPFRRDRVQRAIELAFRATNEIPENDPLPKAIFQEVKRVTDQVVEACFEQARSGACLTVEGIQDVVEQQLLEGGH